MFKIMKKIGLYWGLTLLSLLPLAAQKIQVITSSPNLADLAREVGGDLVQSYALCKPYENPHFLDVNPAYMLKLHHAQLFVETGLGAEPWVTPLLQGARNAQIQRGAAGYVNASRGIQVLEIPAVVSRELGDVHAQGNSHYLMDPVNSKVVAANICDGLIRIDPGHSEVFRSNLAAYHQKLRATLVKWLVRIKPYAGKIKVVTYHRTWSYFARRFSLEYLDTIEAKPGIAPSSSHLEALIQKMKDENCQIILVEHWFGREAADYVASKTGAAVLYVTTEVDGKEVHSYLELFDYLLSAMLQQVQK